MLLECAVYSCLPNEIDSLLSSNVKVTERCLALAISTRERLLIRKILQHNESEIAIVIGSIVGNAPRLCDDLLKGKSSIADLASSSHKIDHNCKLNLVAYAAIFYDARWALEKVNRDVLRADLATCVNLAKKKRAWDCLNYLFSIHDPDRITRYVFHGEAYNFHVTKAISRYSDRVAVTLHPTTFDTFREIYTSVYLWENPPLEISDPDVEELYAMKILAYYGKTRQLTPDSFRSLFDGKRLTVQRLMQYFIDLGSRYLCIQLLKKVPKLVDRGTYTPTGSAYITSLIKHCKLNFDTDKYIEPTTVRYMIISNLMGREESLRLAKRCITNKWIEVLQVLIKELPDCKEELCQLVKEDESLYDSLF